MESENENERCNSLQKKRRHQAFLRYQRNVRLMNELMTDKIITTKANDEVLNASKVTMLTDLLEQEQQEVAILEEKNDNAGVIMTTQQRNIFNHSIDLLQKSETLEDLTIHKNATERKLAALTFLT